jgi:WD40 repeat protein
LAGSAGQGFVTVTDVASRKEVHRYEASDGFVHAAVSPDGRRVAAAAYNRPVLLWDGGSSPKPAAFRPGLFEVVNCLAFSADNKQLVWGCADGSVRTWEGESPDSKPTPLAGHKKAITSVAYSPDNTMVAASAIDGRVIVWDAATRERLIEWQFPGPVHGVAFDEKSRYLATANGNGTAFILRLRKP